MSTTQQQDAPKCTAADGLAEIFNVPGHPLLVRAVDFNRLHAENETLRMGYAAARLEIESLRAAQPAAPQPGAAYAALPSYEHQLAIMESERNASLDAYSRVVTITSAESRLYERAFTSGWDRRDRLASYGQAPAQQGHEWGCRANAFGPCTCGQASAQAAPAAVEGPSDAEPLHITHGPLMRHAAYLLRSRKPALPEHESVAAELELAADGHPTPSGEPSKEWLEVVRLAAAPTSQPAPQQEVQANTKTHDLLSTMIGLFLGAKDKIGYKPGSVVDKVVAEAVEHLKDWPYPEPAPKDPPPSPAAQVDALTKAARDVLAERQRQISAEGWTPEHDDEHLPGELSLAAASYVCADEGDAPPAIWPWDWSWWKPRDRRRNLVKSGALVLAELERMDRADAARTAQEGK